MDFARGRSRVLRPAFALLVVSASLLVAGHASAAPPPKDVPGEYALLGTFPLQTSDATHSLTLGTNSSLYAVETFNHRVVKYTTSGSLIGSWGGEGRGVGEFDHPDGIAANPFGDVYVADTNNNRIQRFTANGNFLADWGAGGSGPGQFDQPRGVDAPGSVLVADTGNDRVQVFTSTGIFVDQWGQGTYEDPIDVAYDGLANVYVLSSAAPKITRSNLSGTDFFSWGEPGAGPGQWSDGQAIAAGGGKIFLADAQNARVQVFLSNGKFLTEFGNADPSESHVTDLATSPEGKVYVLDEYLGIMRLRRFGVIAQFAFNTKQKLGPISLELTATDLASEVALKGKAIVSAKTSTQRALKARKRFRLRQKTVALEANETATVKLLFRRQAKTIAELADRIKRGRKVSAKITAVATDANGASSSQQLELKKLRR